MVKETSTLSVGGQGWIASQVDSSRTKWALTALLFVSVAGNLLLSSELIRKSRQDSAREPLVVGIDSATGRPSVIPASDLKFVPLESNVRFHLRRWARLYYTRLHGIIGESQPEAYRFLHDSISAKLAQENSQEIMEFVKKRDAPQTEVTVKNVIPHLEKEPYRADIQFTKTIRGLGEPKTENWTTEVRFEFLKRVPKDIEEYNPLGMLITYIHGNPEF